MITKKKNQILNELFVNDFTNITELASKLKWPRTTLVYYINELLDEGLLVKEHGEVAKRTLSYENKTGIKATEKQKEKKAIAKEASQYIQDGDIIYIDSGSTTLFLLDYIKNKSIIIYTNNISLVERLSVTGFQPKVFMVPGEIYVKTSSVTGVLAISFLSKVFIDKAFLGLNSTLGDKYITTNPEEATLKEAIIKNAKKTYILFDKSKITKGRGNFVFARKDKNIVEVIR